MSVETVDPAPCGSYILHRPHKYYTGFMGWKTKECGGSPWPECQVEVPDELEESGSAEIPMKIIDHKHDFKLTRESPIGPVRDSDIMWACDWLDCRHLFITERDLWHRKGGVNYDVY